MNYQEAKSTKEDLENFVDQHSQTLKKFPRGEMGMIPDEVKFTEEYQTAKNGYDAAFKRLQTFNQWFMKNFKKEYLADRKKL